MLVLLAIDSGNTNIVFAVFSNTGDLQGEWRAGTESNRTADEFGIWLIGYHEDADAGSHNNDQCQAKLDFDFYNRRGLVAPIGLLANFT